MAKRSAQQQTSVPASRVPTRRESIRDGFVRGSAAFIGGFSLLNLVGDLLRPGYDANIWWIDFRPLPEMFARACLIAAAALLPAYACLPNMSRWRKALTILTTGVLTGVAARNVIGFYILLCNGRIRAGVPLPFSLLVFLALLVLIPTLVVAAQRRHRKLEWFAAAATVAACVIVFPLAQMICFGKTDYRRKADAIVVFGARTYADGRPSDALADRVRTACRLYLDGLAPRMIMSGGPGDGGVHETEAMRRMAVSLGVPDKAILLDPDGISTRATVRNTCDLFDRLGTHRALVVSHFYHLPRVKMSYQQKGREVYTVPAKESYTLSWMPYYILREIAGLWVYYLEPLAGRG
jgi:uncharacterized SAM-binding protein YcdF (DUF218 family)